MKSHTNLLYTFPLPYRDGFTTHCVGVNSSYLTNVMKGDRPSRKHCREGYLEVCH